MATAPKEEDEIQVVPLRAQVIPTLSEIPMLIEKNENSIDEKKAGNVGNPDEIVAVARVARLANVNGEALPPLDPQYIAEIGKEGRIVHEIGADEHVWADSASAAATRNAESASTAEQTAERVEEKEEEEGVHENAAKDDKNVEKDNNGDVKDVTGAVAVAAAAAVTAQQANNVEERRVLLRPAPFPDAEVSTLHDYAATASANDRETRVLSLSEAAEQKKKDEHDAFEARKKSALEREYERVKERQAHAEQRFINDRARQWQFWATMPVRINALMREWLSHVDAQICAVCKNALLSSDEARTVSDDLFAVSGALRATNQRDVDERDGVHEGKDVQKNANQAKHEKNAEKHADKRDGAQDAQKTVESSAIRQPWNAELAQHDLDATSLHRMKHDSVARVVMLRDALQRYQKSDPWILLPCRHAVHGTPCALRCFQRGVTQCPRCRAAVQSLVPISRAVFGDEFDDNNDDDDDANEKVDKDGGKGESREKDAKEEEKGKEKDATDSLSLARDQRRWIYATLQCPPPLLNVVSLDDASRRSLYSAERAPPPPPMSSFFPRANQRTETSAENSDTSTSSSRPVQMLRTRQRDKMDLAHERLVQKYVLLDQLVDAAIGKQDADEFMAVAKRLELLEPDRKARAHLWQTLEPPSEYRANIDRAVALTKAVAAIDDGAPLEWLAKRGFIDRDTIASLTRGTVNASWIASLPRAAQSLLLEKVAAASPSGEFDEPWWRAVVESGLHDPLAVLPLLRRYPADSDARREQAEKWATEAERYNRFALAVELRKQK